MNDKAIVRLKNCLIVFLILNCVDAVHAQLILKGKVIDAGTREPVAYANVGVTEAEAGTVTDENGNFELNIPGNPQTVLLKTAHISFYPSDFKATAIRQDSIYIFELKNKPAQIGEITITSQQIFELGLKPAESAIKGYFDTRGLGTEGGVLIKNTSRINIADFNMHVIRSTFDSLLFRVNFYTVKKNKPDKKINRTDILFTVHNTREEDISVPVNIITEGDFICTIELLKIISGNEAKPAIYFSAVQKKGSITLKRKTSFAKWELIKDAGLCFWFHAAELKDR